MTPEELRKIEKQLRKDHPDLSDTVIEVYLILVSVGFKELKSKGGEQDVEVHNAHK